MKYHLRYRMSDFGEWKFATFETLDLALSFIGSYRHKPEFKFEMIYGTEIEFDESELITMVSA